MVFHWSLSDSKSPQVFRTLLSILAVLSNAVIWIVSTRPPTSKSSRHFDNPLVIVPKASITIGTIVIFMFHSFFNSLVRSRYLFFFSHFFSFILWFLLSLLFYTLCHFLTPVLADGRSLDSEWQQVSSSLLDFSRYYYYYYSISANSLIVIIIIIIITSVFFPPDFSSLESGWLQVTSSLQDSFQYYHY